MVCKRCEGDKFQVLNVWRSKKLVNDPKGEHGTKWVVDVRVDSRLIICAECGSRFITETTCSGDVVFDEGSWVRKHVISEQRAEDRGLNEK